MIFDNREELDVGISVVIPTYNKSALLKMTIDSLLNQSEENDLYEIIIVDDGSNDDTYTLVNNYKKSQCNIRYFLTPDDGFRVSRARNIGINAAKKEIILLLDSGMIAGSDLIKEHLNIHNNIENIAVTGLSYGVSEVKLSACSTIIELLSNLSIDESLKKMATIKNVQDCRSEFFRSINFDLSKLSAPWVTYWSGHVSFRKSAAIDIGGFDEWFTSWGGEDVDFGYRLHENEVNFVALNSVHTIHYPHQKDTHSKQTSGEKNLAYMNNKISNCWLAALTSKSWMDVCNISLVTCEDIHD